jgi:hypothetical protein
MLLHAWRTSLALELPTIAFSVKLTHTQLPELQAVAHAQVAITTTHQAILVLPVLLLRTRPLVLLI